MDSTTKRHRRATRRSAAAATAALLVLGGIAVAAPASAAEGDVVAATGQLDWGYKASFRNYVAGGGALSASDGATRSGAATNSGFLFPVTAGEVVDAENLSIQTSGKAGFSYPTHFFDVQLSNLAVVVEGGEASIVADTYLWAGIDFGTTPTGTHVAEDVDLADAANVVVTLDETAGTVTVTGTGLMVTEAGAAANPLYAAGTALDDFSVTASYEVAEEPVDPEPEPGEGDIVVDVPEAAEPPSGSFGWAWATTSPADLGTAADTGNGTFHALGSLNPIVVTDTRAGGTTPYGWTLTGSVSDFAAGSDTFSSALLAWQPSATGDAGVTAGPSVTGLNTSQLLASSTAAANAQVQAGLSLEIPSSTPAGSYTATVTITAVG